MEYSLCYVAKRTVKNNTMKKNFRFKVRHHIRDLYVVIDCGGGGAWFEGTLADCEAWIRLREGGYI